MRTANGRPSIRRRLMVFLIGSLLLMIAGAAIVTYSVAWRSANDAYDRSLLDPAFDIADNVSVDAHGAHVDLPQKALEALVYDQTDKVIFQVRSPGNAIIDGVADLPPPPPFASEQFKFFDSTYRGEKMRVAALRAPNGFIVQVGETLHKRTRLVGEILVAELVPALLIAVASIALAWFGVSRGLVPLEHLRAELSSRAPRDLRPLSTGGRARRDSAGRQRVQQLLDHVRDTNLLQQRFLANAAHQLRTPLAGLQMHLELLLRRELPADVRVGADADARRHRAREPTCEPASRAGQGRKRARVGPRLRNRRPARRRRRRGARLGAEGPRAEDRPGIRARTRRHSGRSAAAARDGRQPDRQCAALHARRAVR